MADKAKEEEKDEDETGFTHVGLRKDTKKKITILAKVLGRKQFRLIQIWADDAWNLAKKAGMVTDAMLDPDPDAAHWIGMSESEVEGMKRLIRKTNGDNDKKGRK